MSSYETPPQEVFDNIKECAIKIWRTYDDTHGYASGKIERVNAIDNVRDNWLFIISMFDSTNEGILYHMVSDESRELLDKLRNEGSILYPVESKQKLLTELNGPDDKRKDLLI